LILAVELEREYSKSDILAGYLNVAPYGGVEYGVETASRDYFHTSAKNLTLAQASMLAAIPQAPSYYSPYASGKYNPAVTSDTFSAEALAGRQHYILDLMVKQGFITSKEADEAKKVDVLAQVQQQAPKYAGIQAPYFVLAAKQQLEQTFGASTVQRGGWKVVTTLNLDLQKKAEDLVAANLPSIKRYGADQEAMVNEDVQTGQIVSQVGGVDFNNPDFGQNNYAAGIKIPPGSSFKPYDYATLLNNNNNVGAGSVFYDSQDALPGYSCTNKNSPKTDKAANCLWDYDFKYPGPLTLRYALGGSRNVPAVKAMLSAVPNDKSNGHITSINKVISTASDMMYNPYNQSKHRSSYNCYGDESLTQTAQCYGASAIGDGAFLHLDDHVNGLSTLARLGKAIPRTYILKITDAANKDVKMPTMLPKQVIKPDAAYIVNDMASDYKASYLPGSCTETNCNTLRAGSYKFQRYNGWHFAVKTGTTNDGYDGLMTSWSTKYATVAWVGNHTRHVTLRSSMETLTEPLTRGWMEYAHKGLPASNWTPPTDLKTAPAFVVRSHVGLGSVEPSPTNDIYPSWYIGSTNTKNASQTIDKVSNKIATNCTPAAAKEFVSNSNVAFWNIDIFKGGRQNIGSSSSGTASASTSNATDDVHNCSDAPPTVTLTAPSTCDTTCTITATITAGTHPLTDERYIQYPGTVTFTLNDGVIHTANVSDSPSTVSFQYNPSSSGSGTLKVNVTDSVLYTGTDRTFINFTSPQQAASQGQIILSLISHSGTNANFSWTPLDGASAYTLCANGTGGSTCKTVSGTSTSLSNFTPTISYSATVTADGITSNKVAWNQ
jgi:penicillin-binding protein 1A